MLDSVNVAVTVRHNYICYVYNISPTTTYCRGTPHLGSCRRTGITNLPWRIYRYHIDTSTHQGVVRHRFYMPYTPAGTTSLCNALGAGAVRQKLPSQDVVCVNRAKATWTWSSPSFVEALPSVTVYDCTTGVYDKSEREEQAFIRVTPPYTHRYAPIRIHERTVLDSRYQATLPSCLATP